MHHAFLYISLPSLHDNNVKVPNFTLFRGWEHTKTTFLFFSKTLIQSFTIQRTKICQYFTNETRWSKPDKV